MCKGNYSASGHVCSSSHINYEPMTFAKRNVIGIYPDPSTDLARSGSITDVFAPGKQTQSGYCSKIHPLEEVVVVAVAVALNGSSLVSQPAK